MLCTVKARSPSVSEEVAAAVEHQLETRMAIVNKTDTVKYEFVSGTLPGSWSTAVAVNVKRERLESFQDWRNPDAKVVTRAVPCDPYITVEGSVHKAILGHNVYGGPLDPAAGTCWLISDVAARLGVSLPLAWGWEYDRIDWAEVFDVGKYEACEEILHGLGLARYQRRKPATWGDETVMWAGQTSTLKVYHKGPEFRKHDFKRLADAWGAGRATELELLANKYIRIELSVKSKKLRQDMRNQAGVQGHGKIQDLRIMSMSRDYLEDLYDEEVARVMKEAEHAMETVRKHEDVRRRLQEVYDGPRANRLYGLWLDLATSGEEFVRKRMNAETFRRNRKMLVEAGVSWLAADVYIRDSAIPAGFSLLRSSPYRLIEEAPEVVAALAPFRSAA